MSQLTPLENWHQAKQSLDLREVLRGGLENFKYGNPAKARCPFHGNGKERTPSLAVYPDNWRCFACDEGGDLVDWFEKRGSLSRIEAIKAALAAAGVRADNCANLRTLPASPRPTSAEPRRDNLNISQLVELAHKALVSGDDTVSTGARAYLEGRGLLQLAEPMGLGVVTAAVVDRMPDARKYQGRIIIPFRQGGRVVYLKARAISEDLEPKYQQPAGKIPCPFNVDAIKQAQEQGYIILSEGETDGLSILAACGADAPAWALPGGKLSDEWLEKLKGLTVYILMDSDPAGQAHEARLVDELGGRGIEARPLSLNRGADVNAFLQAHGPEALRAELAELMDEADKMAVSDLAYVVGGFLQEVEDRGNREHVAFPTGLAGFDALLGGGFVEGLHVIGGIPGGGKTALCLQIATHNAREGRPVLYVSYEQPKFELWSRIQSGLTGIPVAAFKTGRYIYQDAGERREMPTAEYLARNHVQDLEQARQMAGFLRIVEGDGDRGRWTVPVIAREAERLKNTYGAPPLVVLDYLQRMPHEEKHDRRELRERVGQVAASLQTLLARGLGCPVVAISSLSRQSYSSTKDPMQALSSFKEAGEIEFTAYTATILYRLEDREQEKVGGSPFSLTSGGNVPLGLWVVKNREGEQGKAFAKFYPKRGKMECGGREK